MIERRLYLLCGGTRDGEWALASPGQPRIQAFKKTFPSAPVGPVATELGLALTPDVLDALLDDVVVETENYDRRVITRGGRGPGALIEVFLARGWEADPRELIEAYDKGPPAEALQRLKEEHERAMMRIIMELATL